MHICAQCWVTLMFYKALFSLFMGVPRFIRVWAKRRFRPLVSVPDFHFFQNREKRGFLYGRIRACPNSVAWEWVLAVSVARVLTNFVNFYFIFVFVIPGPPYEIFISRVRPQRNLARSRDFKIFEIHWSQDLLIFYSLYIHVQIFKFFLKIIFEMIGACGMLSTASWSQEKHR